jgi:NAD-dependent dihydropyrimidine dehydrogenase PreA subunit
MVFMHIALPLFLLFIMWVHILRISRPKVNPPRRLAILMLVALFAVSLWRPALSQGPADLAKAPVEIGLDWFFLPLYPLVDMWGRGEVWAFLGVFSLIIAAMPWLPPFRRAKPAEVDLAHCNGCARCAEDCPYEAIRLVPRTDGLPSRPRHKSIWRIACHAASASVHAPRRPRSGARRTSGLGSIFPIIG